MARFSRMVVWLAAATLTAGLGVWASQRVQSRSPAPRWAVTGQFSAHHVLIAHVETLYLDEARVIAGELTEPLKNRYAEILVYFHRPGRPDTLPPRRVQWTPRHGYVETVY